MKIVLLLVGICLAACASSPDYVPESGEAATLGGRTAAEYQLPSDADGKANVRIASFGFIEAKPKDRDEKVKALHLRMNVSSESDAPVTIDVREQIVEGPKGGRHVPGYVKSDAGDAPEVTIAPRNARTFDFYYEVPEEYAKQPEPKNFTLHWTVNVGGEAITRSTPFQQVAVDPVIAQQEASQNLAYGWAAPAYGPWSAWGPWSYWY
jgi:hypothetical protein